MPQPVAQPVAGSHYAIFVVKVLSSVWTTKDENLAPAHIIRLHATASLTLRDKSFPSVTSGSRRSWWFVVAVLGVVLEHHTGVACVPRSHNQCGSGLCPAHTMRFLSSRLLSSVWTTKDENLATAHIIRLHATASLSLRDNSFPSVTSGSRRSWWISEN